MTLDNQNTPIGNQFLCLWQKQTEEGEPQSKNISESEQKILTFLKEKIAFFNPNDASLLRDFQGKFKSKSDLGNEIQAQVNTLLNVLSDQKTTFQDLPPELVGEIRKMLSSKEQMNMTLVENRIQQLANHPTQLADFIGRLEIKVPIDTLIKQIQKCGNEMRSFSLTSCDFIKPGNTTFAENKRALLNTLIEKCPNLHSLSLYPLSEENEILEWVKKFPSLHTIDLMATEITDAGLIEIAKSYPDLKTIKLAGTSVTDRGVIALSQHCSGLQHLSFPSSVTNKSAQAMIKNCPYLHTAEGLDQNDYDHVRLRELCRLNRCFAENFNNPAALARALPTGWSRESWLQEERLIEILDRCGSYVTNLNLSEIFIENIDKLINKVAIRCPNIKHLSLSRIDTVSDKTIQLVAEKYPLLETITLSGTQVTDKGAKLLPEYFPYLQTINLSYTSVTEEGARTVAKQCPNLKSIYLEGVIKKQKNEFAQFLVETCPRLQNPDFMHRDDFLPDSEIGESGDRSRKIYKKLQRHCNINKLIDFIENTPTSQISQHPFRDSLNSNLTGLPEKYLLKLVEMCGPYTKTISFIIDDFSIYSFNCIGFIQLMAKKCPNIKGLGWNHRSKASDEVIEAIVESYPTMQRIFIDGGTKITAKGIQTLIDKWHEHLTSVHIDNAVTDETVTTLTKCRKLEKVHLGYGVSETSILTLMSQASPTLKSISCSNEYSFSDETQSKLRAFKPNLRRPIWY